MNEVNPYEPPRLEEYEHIEQTYDAESVQYTEDKHWAVILLATAIAVVLIFLMSVS
jgi:hypothetical protein